MNETYLTRSDILKRFGFGATTFWRMCKSGRFPRPICMGSVRQLRWTEASVNAWIAAQEAAK